MLQIAVKLSKEVFLLPLWALIFLNCGELAVYPQFNRDYWLYLEIKETATLKDVDQFPRANMAKYYIVIVSN